jgi:hypothetical protein
VKMAQSMFIRFKDEDKKFTGVIDQSLSEFIDEYIQACNSVGVPRNQRLHHLHNVLGGEAKRFYNKQVQENYATFEEAVAVLEREYSSFPRQQRILTHLENLRVPPLLAKGKTKSEALHQIWQEITRLGPQCPPSHRSDEIKVAMLRAAVIGNSWARDPVSRAATTPMTLHALYTQLEASIQIENEEFAAKRKDAASYGRFPSAGDADAISDKSTRASASFLPGIHFQRYGRSIRGLPNGSVLSELPVNPQAATFAKRIGYPRANLEDSADSGCFNCGQPGHRAYSQKCQKDVGNVRINANRVKWLDEKYGAKQGVSRVLYEISVAQNEFETFLAALLGDDEYSSEEDDASSFVRFTEHVSSDNTAPTDNSEQGTDQSTLFSLLSEINKHRSLSKGFAHSPFSTKN